MSPGRRPVGRGVKIAFVCLVVGAPLVVSVGPAIAAEGVVVGRPQLELFAPDNRVVGGEEVGLEVFVSNAGQITRPGPAQFEERVTTARNVRFEVLTEELPDELTGTVDVLTGTVPVGTVPQGTAGPFQLGLEIDDGVEPGTYEIPIQVSYDYTRFIEYSDFREPVYTETSREETRRLTIVVRDQPRFEVTSSGPVVTAGDSSLRSVTVTNVGSAPANNATLTLSTGESPLSFPGRGDGRSAQVALDRLEPGASSSVSVRIGAPATIPPGAYPLSASVDYQTAGGIASQSRPVSVSVPVGSEQSFAVTNVSDTLQVGQRGTVSGTVVNTGGQTISNAVVVFPPNATGLRPRTAEYAVGTLEPGENASFEFVVDTANGTGAGPRLLPFTVRYRNPDDEIRASSAVDAPVTLDTEQTFAVRAVESNFQVGAGGTLVGRVRNTGNRTVSDAVVVFESGGAIQPRETRYPVGTLEPGDESRFQFPADVSAAIDAGPQFVTFRVRYRGGNDQIRQSDPIDATVQVGPEQSFSIRNVTDTLQAGETGTIEGTVVNTGNQTVTDAVVVFATNGTTVEPRTREIAVGTLEPGESAPFSVTADVPRTADTGSRPLVFRVRYRDDDDEIRTSDPLDARVEVDREQSFTIDAVESTLRVGERGRVVATLRNTGNRTVEDVRLVYTGEGLVPLSAESAAGTLEPDESAQVSYTFDIPRAADPGRRALPFVVQYRGRDDEVRTSAPLSIQTTVGPEQTFALENTSSTLRVDDTGTVRGSIVNTGDIAAESVVVTVQETGPTLIPRERAFAVGRLEPGERAPVEFRFDVTADAEPGPRLLTVQIRYRGQDRQVQVTEDIDAPIDIGPQRDEFVVTVADATIPAGSSEVVTLRVRNRENETLRDVRARLFVDDPLASDNSEAFITELGPNETATLRFAVSADAGAVRKQYPLLVDFTYEDESGESVLSDTYFVAADIVEPPAREFPVPIVPAAVGLVVLVLAALLYVKRGAIVGALGR